MNGLRGKRQKEKEKKPRTGGEVRSSFYIFPPKTSDLSVTRAPTHPLFLPSNSVSENTSSSSSSSYLPTYLTILEAIVPRFSFSNKRASN